MAKRKQEDPPSGSPAWMATFSDLMNLLLCFFVLLFAMSSVDEDKFEQLVASLSASFGVVEGGSTSVLEGTLISSGIDNLNELSDYYNTLGVASQGDPNSVMESLEEAEEEQLVEMLEETRQNQGIEESEQMAEELEDAIDEAGIEGKIDIQVDSQYVQLTLNGALLFDSAQAQIKSGAQELVNKVGDILKYYEDNKIEIEGHTDSVPLIGDARYADNAELSSARALSVAKYLYQEKGIPIKNMKWTGRGEYEPIASNDTEEGRALNRRVEIKIYNELYSKDLKSKKSKKNKKSNKK